MTGGTQERKCLLCNSILDHVVENPETRESTYFDCPNCGKYELGGTLEACLTRSESKYTPLQRTILSYAIYGMQRENGHPDLGTEIDETILKNTHLPKPFEQLDKLILWLGGHLHGPGAYLELDPNNLRAYLGVSDRAAVEFLIDAGEDEGHIKSSGTINRTRLTLSFSGWREYEELTRGKTEGRKAFMAMEFGDEMLTRACNDCFRPACRRAGFNLVILNDPPKAGHIDVRMEAEIRRSQFLIADLTHGNRGAYWEAGFAEGLGKPVIYTCESVHFRGIHFDANHRYTIRWSAESLQEAEEELVATIRATLPEIAVFDD